MKGILDKKKILLITAVVIIIAGMILAVFWWKGRGEQKKRVCVYACAGGTYLFGWGQYGDFL